MFIGLALSTPIYALDTIHDVLKFINDAVQALIKVTTCDLKGCKTVYKPAPGYPANYKYWTESDIQDHFSEFKNQYSFDNSLPPAEALAALPNNPDDTTAIARITTSGLTPATEFPIAQYRNQLRKGDIYFSRSATVAGAIFQYVTSWFHCGVFINPKTGETFEAQVSFGVRQSNIANLGPAYSWSVKRIKSDILSEAQVSNVINNGLRNYEYKPYTPAVLASIARGEFIGKWAGKWDNESYYCSKLVWKIYRDAGIDLDSERTTCQVKDLYLSAKTGAGLQNPQAWIGVTPDDIYYSPHLSSDILLIGKENLVRPIPGIIPIERKARTQK